MTIIFFDDALAFSISHLSPNPFQTFPAPSISFHFTSPASPSLQKHTHPTKPNETLPKNPLKNSPLFLFLFWSKNHHLKPLGRGAWSSPRRGFLEESKGIRSLEEEGVGVW